MNSIAKLSIHRLVYFFTLLALGISCRQENIRKLPGQLQFSLANPTSHTGGRVASTASPAFALLSIKDGQGNLVQSNKKIILYNFGGSYVTESLQLSVGSYSLTQFMILDSANSVLYATPMEGSALAQYVTDPLPINFSITENGITLVTPQVLAVTAQTLPE